MFIAALFIIDPNWKPCRYPSMDEPNCGTSIYEILLSRKNERLIHAITWIDLKRNMVTEKMINSDAYILYDFTYITFLK